MENLNLRKEEVEAMAAAQLSMSQQLRIQKDWLTMFTKISNEEQASKEKQLAYEAALTNFEDSKKELTAINITMEKLKKELLSKDGRVASLELEKTTQEDTIQNFEKTQAELKESLLAKQTTIKNFDSMVVGLNKDLETKVGKIARLEAENLALRKTASKVENLMFDLNEANTSIVELRKELAEATEKVKKFGIENSSLLNASGKLEGVKGELRSVVSRIEMERDNNTKDDNVIKGMQFAIKIILESFPELKNKRK